jgi:hypothetical protein
MTLLVAHQDGTKDQIADTIEGKARQQLRGRRKNMAKVFWALGTRRKIARFYKAISLEPATVEHV